MCIRDSDIDDRFTLTPDSFIICEGKETETLYFKHFRSRNCLVDKMCIRDSEYTVREDILMEMEQLELTISQSKALLISPSPLADVYRYFEKLETDHMDVVRDSIENRADELVEQSIRWLSKYRSIRKFTKSTLT